MYLLNSKLRVIAWYLFLFPTVQKFQKINQEK